MGGVRMAWVDNKTRLGTFFDYVRFWGSVTIKDTTGEVLIHGDFDKVKLQKYRSWFVVRVDGKTITVSEEEVDAEKICLPVADFKEYCIKNGCSIDTDFYENSGMFVQN